jgi:DNA-binding CsgD family transcriptional regulator
MTMHRGLDPISIIEAGYDLDSDDVSWLRRIATEAAPLVDEGLGAQAWTYRLHHGQQEVTGIEFSDARGRGLLEAMTRTASAMDHAPFLTGYRTGPVITYLGSLARHAPGTSAPPVYLQLAKESGFRDILKVSITDPDGGGIALGACLTRSDPLAVGRVDTLSRVAAHLHTGFRARRRRARAIDDAMLRPDGKLEHAERDARGRRARDDLRAAAIAIDRARGSQRRRDPEAALTAWRALVQGKWTLFDRFESDGRRYLVARRNEPRSRDSMSGALTAQETVCAFYAATGHAQKLIAYELGIGASTVSTHLRRAMKKLNVRTRAELSEIVGGFVAASQE